MLVLGYKIATNLIYRVEITDRSKLVWICTGRLKMNDKMELENVSKNSFDVKPQNCPDCFKKNPLTPLRKGKAAANRCLFLLS